MMGRTCAVSNPGYESIISMLVPGGSVESEV